MSGPKKTQKVQIRPNIGSHFKSGLNGPVQTFLEAKISTYCAKVFSFSCVFRAPVTVSTYAKKNTKGAFSYAFKVLESWRHQHLSLLAVV